MVLLGLISHPLGWVGIARDIGGRGPVPSPWHQGLGFSYSMLSSKSFSASGPIVDILIVRSNCDIQLYDAEAIGLQEE